MMGPVWLLLALCAAIVFDAGVDSANPRFKLRDAKKGLDNANQQASSALSRAFRGIPLPRMEGRDGEISYNVSKVFGTKRQSSPSNYRERGIDSEKAGGNYEPSTPLSRAGRQANVRKAIRFAGIGYNLLRADPDVAGNGGVDPGYLPTRKIIKVDSGDNPPQVATVYRHSCVSRTTTSTVYDEKSFQKKFDIDVKIGLGVSTATVEARFGLSTSYSQAKDQTTKQKTLFRERQEICNYGSARVKLGLDSIRVTTEFQGAICRLPDNYDEGAYVRFINDWGTGFTVKVDVGKRDLYKKTEKMTSIFNSMSTSLAIGANAEVQYNAVFASVEGSIEMNMNLMENSQSFSESFKGTETHRIIGTSDLPEPISVEINGIQTLLEAKYFQGSSSSACSTSKVAKLPTIRQNLERALGRYPAVKNVYVGDSNGKVKLKLNWPKSTYALFKPKVGCPSGWDGTGWHKWDNPSFHIAAYKPIIHALKGTFDLRKPITYRFCIKKQAITSPTEDLDWQAGEYCLLKYRSCPQGLEEGSIYFNDHNTNINSAGGHLPDGNFHARAGTTMKFCCRHDGHNNIPIFLPTAKPFFMVQATRYGCQAVAGMKVHGVHAGWYTGETAETDKIVGSAPYVYNYRISSAFYICYYRL